MRRLTEWREKKFTPKGDKDGVCIDYRARKEIYGKYKVALSLSQTISISMQDTQFKPRAGDKLIYA